jgi:hypothetical protein
MGELLAWVGGPKAIIGLFIPLLAMAARRSASLYVRYRVLGLGSNRLDVVLTSSRQKDDPDVGFARPTTGRGSVQAFGAVVRSVGRYYRRLPVKVQFSSRVDGRLDADLVCIGGPRANEVTASILASDQVRGVLLRFDDLHRCLTVGTTVIEDYDLGSVDGVPSRDIGMLLICRSPFTVRPRRALVCCGFTSYGTAGTADWFFGDVLTDSWHRPLARRFGIPRWRLEPGACFVAVLEFQISHGTVIGERVLSSRLYHPATP